MKKIAFVIRSLGMGGTEKALINLLNVMPESIYDIDVYVFENDRSILYQLNRKINIIPVVIPDNIKADVKTNISKGKILTVSRILSAVLAIKTNPPGSLKYKKSVAKLIPASDVFYDDAIYFSLPTDIGLFFTRNKIRARKYYTWIHMDLAAYNPAEINPMWEIYRTYDKAICVSEHCRESAEQVFPQLKGKTVVFHNILDYDQIFQLAEHEPEYSISTDKKLIFTCSRLSPEKRPEWTIEIMEELLRRNLDVIWLWAGGGREEENLKKQITEKHLDNRILLPGMVPNPYPYYKNCDVYVQLSAHESYCLALAEAVAFNANVVSTDFQTAYEITQNRENCIIGHTKENITDGIESLLNSTKTTADLVPSKSDISVFEQLL